MPYCCMVKAMHVRKLWTLWVLLWKHPFTWRPDSEGGLDADLVSPWPENASNEKKAITGLRVGELFKAINIRRWRCSSLQWGLEEQIKNPIYTIGGTKIPNKKKFRGKGVHVPSENCDNFFILRDRLWWDKVKWKMTSEWWLHLWIIEYLHDQCY